MADHPPLSGLPTRFLEAAKAFEGQKRPPVALWNPAWCGEIDMKIAADGRWFYLGTPINRPALVKLFASLLRKEGAAYSLVTPVERVGIKVDDAPFLAVEMEEMAGDNGPTLAFRTNLDEIVVLDEAHPLSFVLDEKDGLKPYIHIRDGLSARLTRSLAFDLAARLEEGADGFHLKANGLVFPVPVARRGG